MSEISNSWSFKATRGPDGDWYFRTVWYWADLLVMSVTVLCLAALFTKRIELIILVFPIIVFMRLFSVVTEGKAGLLHVASGWVKVGGMLGSKKFFWEEIFSVGCEESDGGFLLTISPFPGRWFGRTERSFHMPAWAHSNEGIQRLMASVPGRRAKDAALVRKFISEFGYGESEDYLGWEADAEGLRKGSEIVSWEQIKSIKYKAVLKNIRMTYETGEGGKGLIFLGLRRGEQPRRFIAMVFDNSHNATADASVFTLVRLLQMQWTEVDGRMAGMIIMSAVLCIIVIVTLGNYVIHPHGLGYLMGLLAVTWITAVIFGTVHAVMLRKDKVRNIMAQRRLGVYSLLSVCLAVFWFLWTTHAVIDWIRGDVLSAQGRYSEAGEYYEKALSFNPASHRVLYDIGVNSYRLGEWERSAGYLEQAHKIKTDYWHWAKASMLLDALWRVGRREDAMRRCEELLGKYDYILPNCNGLEARLMKMREAGFDYSKMKSMFK